MPPAASLFSRPSLLSRLALAILLLAGVAGLGVAQERRQTLPELEKARTHAIAAHHEARTKQIALDKQLGTATKELDQANARVRAAEADGGPFAASEVKRLRAEARTVANRKAAIVLKRAELTPQLELLRVREIDARSSYASRLMEVAYRLGTQPRGDQLQRKRQIREYTDSALADLSAIADLRTTGKEGKDLGTPVPPLDPSATPEEMEWRLKAYRRQIKTFNTQLTALKPREQRLVRHVEHLNKLLERGYAIPALRKTLEREQDELTQVQGLRQAIEKQVDYYQKLAVRLQGRIEKANQWREQKRK